MKTLLPWGIVAAAYLLGSIPFGLIFGRFLGGVDVRTAGSGNIGFTNVLRTAGKGAAALTLLGDVGKGVVAVLAATRLLSDTGWELTAAMAVVIGHNYPLFLRFRGGKGVATSFGALFACDPLLGGLTLALWAIPVLIWRYASLGALVAFGLLPVAVLVLRYPAAMLLFAVFLGVMTIYRHQENLRRLLSGTERRMGASGDQEVGNQENPPIPPFDKGGQRGDLKWGDLRSQGSEVRRKV
jgi:glycerol-3-phosphate acyltransferase PlsY